MADLGKLFGVEKESSAHQALGRSWGAGKSGAIALRVIKDDDDAGFLQEPMFPVIPRNVFHKRPQSPANDQTVFIAGHHVSQSPAGFHYAISEADVLQEYSKQMLSVPTQLDLNRSENVERLNELRDDALADGEPFKEASAKSLLRFCTLVAPQEPPAIFLLDNGNLRCLWAEARNQIAIQFLENGWLQYVLFREMAGVIVDNIGTATSVREMRAFIEDAGLTYLWSRGRG